MNPFVTFLILLPLVVAVLLWIGTIVYTANQGLSGEVIFLHMVFGSISIGLVYLLIRAARSQMLDDQELRYLDDVAKRRFTNSALATIYFTLLMCLVFVTKPENVRYWIGALSTLMAISMLVAACYNGKKSGKRDFYKLEKNPPTSPEDREVESLQYLATRNCLCVSSLTTALAVSFVYWRFDGSRWISLFDIIGLLVLLVTFNLWFTLSGKKQ